jgi:Flp pilus assembly CpaE family ATPase
MAEDVFSRASAAFALEFAGQLSMAVDRVAHGGVDVILLDLMLPDSRGFDTFLRMQQHARNLPIIVMSSLDDAELALQAVQAGAEDYLVKGRMSGASLLRCVRHAVERHRRIAALLNDVQGRSTGSVISFIGAKGGVGTTTLVLNAAAALGRRGVDTVAVELQATSGFSLHLKMSHTPSLGDLAELEPEGFNPQAVDQKLVRLPFGYRALFAPSGNDFLKTRPEQVTALLRQTASLAEFTFVDLPSQFTGAHEPAVRASRYVCLALEPDPLCLKGAISLLEAVQSWGLHSSACGAVVFTKQAISNALKPQEIRTRLGIEIVGIVPPAAEACILAAEAGKPLVSLRPEALFSEAVTEIAENLVQRPVRTLQF